MARKPILFLERIYKISGDSEYGVSEVYYIIQILACLSMVYNEDRLSVWQTITYQAVRISAIDRFQ